MVAIACRRMIVVDATGDPDGRVDPIGRIPETGQLESEVLIRVIDVVQTIILVKQVYLVPIGESEIQAATEVIGDVVDVGMGQRTIQRQGSLVQDVTVRIGNPIFRIHGIELGKRVVPVHPASESEVHTGRLADTELVQDAILVPRGRHIDVAVKLLAPQLEPMERQRGIGL